MAEVVDAIVAELVLKGLQQYEQGLDRATAAHGRFEKSVDKIKAQAFDLQAEGQKYRQAGNTISGAAEQTDAKITRSRKKRAADSVAADEREVASAKKAAKEKADAARAEQVAIARVRDAEIKAARQRRQEMLALKATEREINNQAKASAFLTGYRPANGQRGEGGLSGRSARSSAAVFRENFKAEEIAARDAAKQEAALAVERDKASAAAAREAEQTSRLSSVAERAAARRAAGLPRGSGTIPNSDLSRPTRASFIPAAALGASQADVAATEEVDHLTRDIAVNKARLVGLEGKEREELQREIAYLETINRLKRAGIADTEAIALAEANVARLQAQQLAASRGQNFKNVSRFAEGAGIGRSFGSTATVGGIAAAAALYGATSAIGAGIDYGKQLADTAQQIGLTTKQLQLYQTAATQAGVSTEQFRSAFGQMSSYLGRAQEGDKQAIKTFQALGISIKDAGSAGDILPTLIARISSIADPAKRAAVETRLFGEEGRRLDAVLGGGTEKINALAESMEKAGTTLSDRDINDLKRAGVALAELKQQLQVDLSRVVAGNTDAIIGLANSFVVLADKAFAAIQRLQQFGARQILEGVVSNFASESDKSQAKAFLLRSRSGRVKLFHEAETQEAAIRAGNGNFDVRPGAPSIAQQRKAALDRISAQKQEIAQAEAASRMPAAPGIQSGTVGDLTKLFAPNAPKGKSADQLAREAEQRTKRFQDDLSRFQEEELRAQESLTGDINARADIEAELAKRAYDRQIADIESEQKQNVLRGADAKLEAARAEQLKAAAKAAYDEQAAGIQQQRRFDLARAQNDNLKRVLQFQGEHLNNELALANTSDERRRIELQLLENAKQQERARLQGVIDTSLPGSPEASSATAQLKTLGARYDDQRAGIIRQTETTLDAYKRSLQVTSDTISDFGVHALQDFNSELDHSITKALHLHGVFGQIVGDLIDMAIKQELISPIANSGGFGGLLGGIGKLFGLGGAASSAAGSTFSIPGIGSSIPYLTGFASGGSAVIGGRGGTDQNVLSINGVDALKVSKGEILSVVNPSLSAGQRVASPAPQQTILVVQPIHADFSGARTDEQTMREFAAYADARSRQAYDAAVATAGSQVSGIVKQKQTLG